jgi:hypothetical protein
MDSILGLVVLKYGYIKFENNNFWEHRMFCILMCFFSCTEPEMEAELECITFYDKCNSACDLQCGSTIEKEAIEQEGICDLGCIEDTGFVPDECVLVDETCQWASD